MMHDTVIKKQFLIHIFSEILLYYMDPLGDNKAVSQEKMQWLVKKMYFT